MKQEDEDRRTTWYMISKVLVLSKLVVTDAGILSRRTMIPKNKDVKLEMHNNAGKRMVIAEVKYFPETSCDDKGFEKDCNLNAKMKLG